MDEETKKRFEELEKRVSVLEDKAYKQIKEPKKISVPFKKDGAAYGLYRLATETDFFEIKLIHTTQEIIRKLKLEFDIKVNTKHAGRDFFKVVKLGILKRDQIGQGKKIQYIWFKPKTKTTEVEAYKKKVIE